MFGESENNQNGLIPLAAVELFKKSDEIENDYKNPNV
jgi:hypothetical protein